MPALSDIPAHYEIARSWRCSALCALSASAPGTLGICFLGIFFLSASQTFAATVTNRVTVAANWNTAATWIQNRTGTVTFTNGSVNVTGVGTQFLTELAAGDVLMLQASPGTVRGTIANGQSRGLHLLAAYWPGTGLVLCQVEVDPSTNEKEDCHDGLQAICHNSLQAEGLLHRECPSYI